MLLQFRRFPLVAFAIFSCFSFDSFGSYGENPFPKLAELQKSGAQVSALIVPLDGTTGPIAELSPNKRLTIASVSKLIVAAKALDFYGEGKVKGLGSSPCICLLFSQPPWFVTGNWLKVARLPPTSPNFTSGLPWEEF